MSLERFHGNARELLYRMLEETPKANRDELVEAYAELFTMMYAREAHTLLGQVFDDAKVRLDARLSPDPVSQGLANVQTTMQDLWDSLWKQD